MTITSKMKTESLIPELSTIVGDVTEHRLNPEQLAAADKVIDKNLMTANASDADKLTGSMIKAFLQLPFEDGNITEALTHFVQADYEISNEKLIHNGKMATTDTRIAVGGLASDAWSISHVITDALSTNSSPYQSISNNVGKQMAMLIYGCEKVVSYYPHPFDVLEEEFKKNGISPFKDIHMLEFAGNRHSVVANQKRGVAKLFGSFNLHNGAAEGRARVDGQGFVSLANPAGLPNRESGVNYIIARNVFNDGAMEEASLAYDNVRNLLCVFSNALPDTGRLYISTSISDIIDVSHSKELLEFTGFKLVGDISHNNNSTPSYVLARDYQIKGPELIKPAELDELPHGNWTKMDQDRGANMVGRITKVSL